MRFPNKLLSFAIFLQGISNLLQVVLSPGPSLFTNLLLNLDVSLVRKPCLAPGLLGSMDLSGPFCVRGRV